MANTIASPNMNLPIPIVGQATGADYALNVDACLMTLDSHDHASGSGVQITPAGLNINSDLPLNGNNLIDVRSVRFDSKSSFPVIAPDLGCLFVIEDDLYFNDEAGNQIRITQAGAVTGASGTITGLPSGTASAAYNAGAGEFTFESASNIGADLDAASIIVREKVLNGEGVTISAPTALAASYSLILPSALPAAQYFTTIDASGSIANPIPLALGIDTANIASNAITTAKITDANVTRAKLAAVGQQVSGSSGSFSTTSTTGVSVTNLTFSLTTSGRPVRLFLQSASGATNPAWGATSGTATIIITRGGVAIDGGIAVHSSAVGGYFTPQTVGCLDVVAAGTYTYDVILKNSGGTSICQQCVLVGYEL